MLSSIFFIKSFASLGIPHRHSDFGTRQILANWWISNQSSYQRLTQAFGWLLHLTVLVTVPYLSIKIVYQCSKKHSCTFAHTLFCKVVYRQTHCGVWEGSMCQKPNKVLMCAELVTPSGRKTVIQPAKKSYIWDVLSFWTTYRLSYFIF